MQYKDYEGPVEELVLIKIREIEEKEQIRILHVIESGSRAWGFASPDSDYDVRFIYVRDQNFYLALQDQRDTIDWELNDVLDINGWDLKKVLQHIWKSNAVIYEWANSPVVYYTTEEWKRIADILLDDYFSCKASMYHYYGTARKNYTDHLMKEQVKYKKYFYVLRPILACRWIEAYHEAPPVLFDTMVQKVLPEKMRAVVDHLLEAKVKMAEGELAPKIPELDHFLESEMDRFQDLLENTQDDRNPDWAPLNEEFRRHLR